MKTVHLHQNSAPSCLVTYFSLIFAQNQECYGGCFSPSAAYDGSLAEVRIWDRILDREFIRSNMYTSNPGDQKDLAIHYNFLEEHISGDKERNLKVQDMSGELF